MSMDLTALGLREYQPFTPTSSDSVTQADFLTLLTTQLKNQDPTSPLENEAFVAQLAQFSTVSGIGEINKQLSALNGLTGQTSMAGVAQWIGRQVEGSNNLAGQVASVTVGADSTFQLTLTTGETMPLSSVVRVS